MKASSTSTSSDPAELEKLATEIEEQTPAPTPDPAPGPTDGGLSSGGPTSGGPDAGDAAAELLDHIGEHPDKLLELTQDDIADLLELAFGLAADEYGKHWEMPGDSKEARRIAKWLDRSVQRHGLAWVAKWLPDVLSIALLANAINKRRKLGAEQKAAK